MNLTGITYIWRPSSRYIALDLCFLAGGSNSDGM